MERRQRSQEIRTGRRWRFLLVVGLLLVGSAVVGLSLWQEGRDWVRTDDAYVTGHVVVVKAQAAGTVTEILAENTEQVPAGAVLVRLEATRAQIAVDEAEATLAGTVRRVAGLYSAVEAIRARIGAEEAALARVRHDLARYGNVDRPGAISAQQVQNATDEARAIEARIRERRAELQGAEAQIANIDTAHHPEVLKAAAAFERAYLEWVRQEVRAPIPGVVARRRVAVGDQVVAGTPLLAVVPLDHLWVEANVKETDLARILPGQAAEIRVDAYGAGRLYHGTVEGIHPGTGSVFALLPPEYATGNYVHIVERVPVRIALRPEELAEAPLRPGLSTLTRIAVGKGQGQGQGEGQGEASGSALASRTRAGRLAATGLYRTEVFADEIAGARGRIAAIVSANLSANLAPNPAAPPTAPPTAQISTPPVPRTEPHPPEKHPTKGPKGPR
jgi:membrane fusion protein (multidrug efflux system)